MYVICRACEGAKDGCGQPCVNVCPVNAIHLRPDGRRYFIDPATCTESGACVPECPVHAIYSEDDAPPDC